MIDQMFTLRQTLDEFQKYDMQIQHLFIDFKEVDDSVKGNELWSVLTGSILERRILILYD